MYRIRLNPLFRRLMTIRQSESAECGLACLAMVCNYFGGRCSLQELRLSHGSGLLGTSMERLQEQAIKIGLESRVLSLSLDKLPNVATPAILHWAFDHYVVLEKCKSRGAIIHDPARGRRLVSLEELDEKFTGLALELWPSKIGVRRTSIPRIRISDILPRMKGLFAVVAPVICLTMGVQIFAISTPIFLQVGIDQVVSGSDHRLLLVVTIGFLVLLALQTLFQYVRGRASIYIATIVNFRMRKDLFHHLMKLPQKYFMARGLGDVVSRFGDVDEINDTITGQTLNSIVDAVLGILLLVMMALYSIWLTTIVALSMLIYFGIRLLLVRAQMRSHADNAASSAKANALLIESVRGVQTLKINNHTKRRTNHYADVLVGMYNDTVREQQLINVKDSIDAAWTGLENIVLVYLGVKMVMAEQFTVGMLFAYLGFRLQLSVLARSVVDSIARLCALRVPLDRIADIVQTDADRIEEAHAIEELGEVLGTIEARNLTFAYHTSMPPVIQKLDFMIHAGECVAIIGPSGCGKTTLAKLILGLLQPTEGELLLDGHRLTPERTKWLRVHTGSVMQDDHLFSGTCQENISMFSNPVDPSRLLEACKGACILDYLQSLPMGLNTRIGDMGSIFSGGEKQRLLFARALYKQPRILILDEATSQLDVVVELAIARTLQAMNLTRIVIAHRPETIKAADRVIDLSSHSNIAARPTSIRETLLLTPTS